MIKRHHNLSYIWSKLKLKALEIARPDLPWLTKSAVELLNDLIRKSDKGLEFGSGRSTNWLAGRCAHLTSIESDEFWFKKVSANIGSNPNVKYHLRAVRNEDGLGSPYLDVFDTIGDGSIDFILNDGKMRDLVALRSVSKLRDGGLFVLDNAERYLPNSLNIPESIGPTGGYNENWRQFELETRSWRRIWTSNGVTSTLIFVKT